MNIKNIAVLGAGQMGRQIALNAANHGYNVVLYDNFPESLSLSKNWAKEYLTKSVEKGVVSKEEFAESLKRLFYTEELHEAIPQADLVIESVTEKESVKRELLCRVAPYYKKGCIIVTNSSYMPSSRFIPYVPRAQELANLHYFNPAMRMQVVEIVRNEYTSDNTVETLKQFVLSIGKKYILVNKEIEGFVVNRLLRAIQNESFFLLENGIASFEDIDIAAEKGLNHPMGPFHLMDFTGLDTSYYSRQADYERTGDPNDLPPISLKKKVEQGNFGRKSGKGWYDYTSK